MCYTPDSVAEVLAWPTKTLAFNIGSHYNYSKESAELKLLWNIENPLQPTLYRRKNYSVSQTALKDNFANDCLFTKHYRERMER